MELPYVLHLTYQYLKLIIELRNKLLEEKALKKEEVPEVAEAPEDAEEFEKLLSAFPPLAQKQPVEAASNAEENAE